jgi:hypothetical protein
MTRPLSLRLSVVHILALLLLVICVVALSNRPERVHAQAATTECRVLLALDNSVSVGSTNWNIFRNQIKSLFSNTTLRNNVPNLKLAFWTFSHSDSGTDFNPYYQDYVTAYGPDSDFGTFGAKLDAASLDGSYTNYAQGFGYNAVREGDTNNFALQLNTNSNIRRIAHSPDNGDPDVIALLTDGAPNHPGMINPGSPQAGEYFGDGNDAATGSAYQARTMYPNTNVIAGFINPNDTNEALKFLGRSINNDDNINASNIGPLEFDNSLSNFLAAKIPDACNVQTIDYNLAPIVQPNTAVISSGTTPTFDYSVRNDTADDTDGKSGWQIYDVTINPGVAGNPLSCGSNSYCDNKAGCPEILGLFGGRGTCGLSKDDNNNGNSANDVTFPPDLKELYANRPATVDNIDDLALGTRVCRVLQLKTPTGSGSASNRIYGACSVVGKAPLVQIHGGDLRVGSRFNDDNTTADPNAGVYVSKFKISKNPATVPNGRTYGSWTEYGVLAPGPIRSMASLSGYSGITGGYDGAISTNSCDLNVNKLTFANIIRDPAHPEQNKECGYLSESPGLIPDVVSSLTSRTPINPASYTTPLRFDQNSPAGLYKNASDNVNVEITASTITKGKTFIVYVPEGTVTISGNINYVDDAGDKYTNITDIPQLVIIAKDIKINEAVNRVDAWLVAAGSESGGGIVDTCANFARPLSSKVCRDQLTINGPVMARELDLWRTKVYEDSCVIEAIEDCKTVGDPAEIITLPGSSILWSQSYGLNLSRAQTTYTTELPPYF